MQEDCELIGRSGLWLREVWIDEPYFWNLELRASSGYMATGLELFNCHPGVFSAFAEQLLAFGGRVEDEAVLGLGEDAKSTSELILRAYLHDRVGHAALQVFTDNKMAAPDNEAAQFTIRCEVAALNRLGAALLTWIQQPEEDLCWIVKPD